MYYLKRFALMFPVLLIISFLTFTLLRLVPGGPFDQEKVNDPVIRANLLAAYDMDAPLGVQYLHANLESQGEGLFLGGVFTNGRRDVDLDTITARLSYKWGGDCCAPVPMK